MQNSARSGNCSQGLEEQSPAVDRCPEVAHVSAEHVVEFAEPLLPPQTTVSSLLVPLRTWLRTFEGSSSQSCPGVAGRLQPHVDLAAGPRHEPGMLAGAFVPQLEISHVELVGQRHGAIDQPAGDCRIVGRHAAIIRDKEVRSRIVRRARSGQTSRAVIPDRRASRTCLEAVRLLSKAARRARSTNLGW